MKADSEIGLVPPLAHFASGGNYPIIRMMKSEWLPLLAPCSHICLCPNRIDPFENINFIFGVDAGVIFVIWDPLIYFLLLILLIWDFLIYLIWLILLIWDPPICLILLILLI